MASAVIRPIHLIVAILATSAVAAQAQTAAPAPAKGWVDPGAVERAKTQAGESTTAAPPAGAAKADAAKVDAAKPSASDSEKLKELIRATEASADAGEAKKARAHAAHHAHPAVIHHAVHTSHAHAAAKKVVAKAHRHPAAHPVAYDYLPNKKDGPVGSSSGPVSAAY